MYQDFHSRKKVHIVFFKGDFQLKSCWVRSWLKNFRSYLWRKIKLNASETPNYVLFCWSRNLGIAWVRILRKKNIFDWMFFGFVTWKFRFMEEISLKSKYEFGIQKINTFFRRFLLNQLTYQESKNIRKHPKTRNLFQLIFWQKGDRIVKQFECSSKNRFSQWLKSKEGVW